MTDSEHKDFQRGYAVGRHDQAQATKCRMGVPLQCHIRRCVDTHYGYCEWAEDLYKLFSTTITLAQLDEACTAWHEALGHDDTSMRVMLENNRKAMSAAFATLGFKVDDAVG